jgi:hypothetical protein
MGIENDSSNGGGEGEASGEGASGGTGHPDGGASSEAGRLIDDKGGESKSDKSEGDKGAGGTGFDSLPAETQREIRELRRNEQRLREEAKGAAKRARDEILAEVGKMLGGGEAEETPEKLRERLGKVSSERSGAMVELAVHRAAGKAGGDPDALLDSRAFLTRVGKLDPEADDFAAKVAEEIKAAVQENPKLGVGMPATRSGGEIGGASGEEAGDSWAEIDKRARAARSRF